MTKVPVNTDSRCVVCSIPLIGLFSGRFLCGPCEMRYPGVVEAAAEELVREETSQYERIKKEVLNHFGL